MGFFEPSVFQVIQNRWYEVTVSPESYHPNYSGSDASEEKIRGNND